VGLKQRPRRNPWTYNSNWNFSISVEWAEKKREKLCLSEPTGWIRQRTPCVTWYIIAFTTVEIQGSADKQISGFSLTCAIPVAITIAITIAITVVILITVAYSSKIERIIINQKACK
jgi:hypothetical protein